MANLVIDIGNSFTKIAVFDINELVWLKSYRLLNWQIFEQIINDYKPDGAIISSVKKTKEPWEQSLNECVPLVKFNAAMAKTIKNHYKTPQTLGLDRLAAVVGAKTLYPNQASVIIDAGTCITYDWVDQHANYFGGSISPGLQMRYKALNHYTDGLPLIEPDGDFDDVIGASTHEAIQSGVENGIKFEMLGFIEALAGKSKPVNIILSGGDSIFFDTLLKNSIFAPHLKNEPHLVLIGLNAVIQQHND